MNEPKNSISSKVSTNEEMIEAIRRIALKKQMGEQLKKSLQHRVDGLENCNYPVDKCWEDLSTDNIRE